MHGGRTILINPIYLVACPFQPEKNTEKQNVNEKSRERTVSFYNGIYRLIRLFRSERAEETEAEAEDGNEKRSVVTTRRYFNYYVVHESIPIYFIIVSTN